MDRPRIVAVKTIRGPDRGTESKIVEASIRETREVRDLDDLAPGSPSLAKSTRDPIPVSFGLDGSGIDVPRSRVWYPDHPDLSTRSNKCGDPKNLYSDRQI